jgi:20S proteasome subunit alpha 1
MHSSQAASAGQRDREAVNFLEKKTKNNPSLSFQETVQVRVFSFI